MSNYADLTLFILYYLSLIIIAFRAGRRLRVPLIKEPCCPNCRTPVAKISTLICPTCSSDLREVGLPVPGMRRPLSFGWMILLWTIFFPVVVYLITMIFTVTPLMLQRVVSLENQISYVNKQFHTMNSIWVTGELRSSSYWSWKTQPDWQPDTDWKNVSSGFIRIILSSEDQYKPNGIITINPATRTWLLKTQDGSELRGTSQFDVSTFERCLNQMNAAIDNNISWKSVIDIFPNLISGRRFDSNLLSQFKTVPGWLMTKPNYFVRPVSPTITNWLTIALAAAIYILGLILIHRWTKREKAALAVTTSYKIQQ